MFAQENQELPAPQLDWTSKVTLREAQSYNCHELAFVNPSRSRDTILKGQMTQPILPYERAVLSLSAWLDDWCGLQIAHDERPTLRLAQFHRYRRSLPTVLKTNIAFALAMTVILAGPGHLWFVLGWGFAVVCLSIVGLRQLNNPRIGTVADPPSPRFTVRVIRDSFLMALPWAVLAIYINGELASRFGIVAGIAITCLSCVGVFAMAILPAAAACFVATLWLGYLSHFLFIEHDMIAAYVVVDAIFLVLAMALIRSVARLFVDHVRADRELADLREMERHRAEQAARERIAIEARVSIFNRSMNDVVAALLAAIEQMGRNADQLSALSGSSRLAVAEVPDMVNAAKRGLLDVKGASQQMGQAIDHIRAMARRASNFVQIAAERLQQSEAAKSQLAGQLDEVDHETALIRNIVRQTKLVALNASIEAARAGPHGAGFSVVANEVKTLAGRINEAAELIIGRIAEIRHASEQTAAATQRIEEAAISAIDSAEQIVASSDHQTRSLDEIAAALSHVIQVSEAAGDATQIVIASSQSALNQADSVSETAQGLQEAARRLTQAVSEFSGSQGS
jgi:methyl-accepting chemotaxis protein